MPAEPVTVAVLMSSYNGAAYIEQQIDSILQQQNVRVNLLIRDDGSTDQTPAILTAIAAQHANISLIFGENLGVIGSFFALLKVASGLAVGPAYYALSDQDDVWDVDKLARACVALDQARTKANADQPSLYCSAVNYVDQDLQHVRRSQVFDQARIGFQNALVQNIATGCTMVFNPRALRRLVVSLPQQCVMHDWWMYLLISAFGTVIYDARPSMQYRQHQQNVLGIAPSLRSRMLRRWRRIMNPQAVRISTQLGELQRLVGNELSLAQRRVLHTLIAAQHSFWPRLGLLCSGAIRRQGLVDDLLIRLLILTGKF